MTENQTVNATTTTTVNKDNEEVFNLSSPLFLLFAEYLGYESPIIAWIDNLMDKKTLQTFQLKFINIEAKMVFKKMQEELGIDDIRHYYKEFYPIVLNKYETKLKDVLLKLNDDENSDLPF